MAYDAYKGVPLHLRPTSTDAIALFHIVGCVRLAIGIRHDFQTAIRVGDKTTRRLGAVPGWESGFAQSFRPGAKTPAGLAAEHKRLALDAQSYISGVKDNAKLAGLLRQNLRSLFPDIGYNGATGDVLPRLVRPEKTVMRIFHPLGVEDNANLIRLLLKNPSSSAFYW